MCMMKMKKKYNRQLRNHPPLPSYLYYIWNPNNQFHNQLMMESTDQTNSAIQGQGYYFDRLILDMSRDSNCMARSYRSYYPTTFPETVPFQWEKRPGLPKNLPGRTDHDVAIPLSPPPVLHGLGLALPRPDHDRSSRRWTARFWRRISSVAGKSCSSSFSTDRRFPSCSVPSPIYKSRGSSSDLRQLYDDSDIAVMAAMAAGSSFSSLSFDSEGILPDVKRCSSAGESSSSRMYYYCGNNGGDGVPFDWEMQPGKSKDPEHPDEIIPPPTPPPAVQGRGLPLPRLDDPAAPDSSKVGYWKKIRLDSSNAASCFKYKTGSEQPWKIDDEEEAWLSHLLPSFLFFFRSRK